MKRIVFCLTLCMLLLAAGTAYAQDALGVADAIIERVDRTAQELERARQALEKAKNIGDEVLVEERTKEYREKREDYRKAEQTLDDAKVQALADASGRSPAEIRAMRESGMGWGRIAKEVGVSPSVLGKGAGKNKSKPDDAYGGDDGDDEESPGKGKNKDKGNRDKGKGKGKK